ncbi:MAG: hypothetical protein PSY14_08850 [bacterium]|nr:hypothetical protein [bacterium]
MKIVYSLSIDDYIAVNQWMANTTPEFAKQYKSIRILFSTGWMSPFLAVALIASISHHGAIRDGATVIGVLLGLINFFSYPTAEKKAREKTLRNFHYGKHGTGSIGRFSMELRDNMLWLSGDRGDSCFALSLISEITHTPDYVLLRRSYLAYILPRGKVMEGDFDKFVSELELLTPPPPPLLAEPHFEPPKNSFLRTSRRAFTAAALSGICAVGFALFSMKCGCGGSKISILVSVLAVAFAIGFIDVAFGLRYKEKNSRTGQASRDTPSEK